ncbi:MAG: 1-deoxy-D-xylulose 5-phosphate synthase [uncultured Acidimicrobiales bacterium]|uniref:1-deoxy-D-xylulose-5-phosphate synthase n=1 Tax=uncultured Acidimicrobiales bacterium TaxID=310071 RepID=A0A6J4JD75_9ACTN|nr:MAG: 1-deoxy-D-xylulose 5-phosphate synthase [uncultured Acidimicrobiales bacterium]
MLLPTIESPADLRPLSYAQIDQLATEIRAFIVQAVSVTGGHLGSNLGVVEITLALHRVFDSPHDVVLWDTGHLAYPHKIVTGRQAAFADLRQESGMSGYPCRAESEHDWVENSHASTILGYAQGMAVALKDTNRKVVALLGDGSMTGGMAYEALNNIGHAGTNCVIVLNDNGRSYAPTVSRLSYPLRKIRMHPDYVRKRERAQQMLERLPVFGEYANAGLSAVRAALREVIEPHAFFEALGVRYTGPVDGHDVQGLEEAFRAAAAFEGPIVVHCLTQKGRGYPPAEKDDEKNLHDAPVFDPLIGPPVGWAAPKGYTQGFSEALIEVATKDERIHAITAAMPGPTGLLPFQARFPERTHDVGIAEQHAAVLAAGMAMGGLKPVVAVYSTFFNRCFDQAAFDVGLHGLPVVFALDRAGITGDDGPSHHGVLDLGLCLKVPGMTIFAPSSVQELGVMLPDALALDAPAVLRFPKGVARTVPPEQVGHGLQARCARRADDASQAVCFLAVGKMVEAAEEAAAKLEAEGVQATVWDVRVVRPLDPAMVADACQHRLVLTCEDGMAVGGAGQFIELALDTHAGPEAPRTVILGTPAEYLTHAKATSILARLGLDAEGLASRALAELDR